MAEPPSTCAVHHPRPAVYRCDGCARGLCEECVEHGHRLILCTHCGELAVPVATGRPVSTVEARRQRRVVRVYTLGEAFLYPFRGTGAWVFWTYVVLLVVSPAIAGYFAIVAMPVAVALSVLFTLGLYWHTRNRQVAGIGALFTGGTTAAATIALTKVLNPYQVARIKSFTNPEAEEYRSGVGFHLVQSKAAIGSGGLFGKGFMEGTQTQGAYVPEQSTDFVFSVIGEEWGFVGALFVLVVFALFLTRLIVLGTQVRHPFGALVAAGAAGIYLIHIFINIGMATGLLPVIGIPLPFISYGGSALLANTAMLAIALNLHMRRDDFSLYGY